MIVIEQQVLVFINQLGYAIVIVLIENVVKSRVHFLLLGLNVVAWALVVLRQEDTQVIKNLIL